MSLLNCVRLEVLDIGNNAINDTFPTWLGPLEELKVLILKSNKFHGSVSTRLKFGFPRLQILDLSHNELSGSLPAEVFQNFKGMIKTDDRDKGEIKYMKTSDSFFVMYDDSVRLVIKGNDMELERVATIMTAIDLSSNHFEGVILKTLKDLGSLWLLNLSHNNLRGDIPMELGRLNMLETLDLSWNQLTGKIPQQLTRMNFLAFLNLSKSPCLDAFLKIHSSTDLKMTHMVLTLISVVLLYQSNVEQVIHRIFLNHWSPKKRTRHILQLILSKEQLIKSCYLVGV